MTGYKDRWLFIGLWGLLTLLAACSPPEPETPASSGTGLAVAPEFGAFYSQYGGAPLFGFPITSSFVDPVSGNLTQYFQHFHLAFDQTQRIVTPQPLGEQFAPSQEWPAETLSENGRQRLFEETGYIVQDEFLVFYEDHGGLTVFGLPITPQFDEGGKLVQYFQNAQLVWNPNALPEFRVELAPLGSTYLWKNGSPVENFISGSSATVTEADIRATVKEPILYAGEEQVLYVSIAATDSLNPVESAAVRATITYAGVTTEITLPQTDEFGRTQAILELPAVEPGQKVQVEIEATSAIGNNLGSTSLSFKTWW